MYLKTACPTAVPGFHLAQLAFASVLCVAATAPLAAIVDSGPVSIVVPASLNGLYLNLVTGLAQTSPPISDGWDFNPYLTSGSLQFNADVIGDPFLAIVGAVVPPDNFATALSPGAIIGPTSGFVFGQVSTTGTTFQTTGTSYVGIRFTNEGTGAVNYGYVQMTTTATTGFPATITRYLYENTGAPIRIPNGPPVLVSASLRRVQGVAGTFDLPLSLDPNNPTTESRAGPNHEIVFSFDQPITSGTVGPTLEGTGVLGGNSISANELIAPFGGVNDTQYVTFAFTGVKAAGFDTILAGSVRVGFLAGDVNQTRQVTVADVGIVNSVLLQTVDTTNYLRDVNADGRLTVADKGITNAHLLKKLPAP